MNLLNNINKSTIIITTNSYKKQILKEKNKLNKLIDIKILTLNEFLKEYTFNYDDKSALYLMKKYNIKYNIAKIYLENLYYVENKNYTSNKLNKLVEIKEDLINNNLLIINNNFKEYIKEKDIIVYNMKTINKYQQKLLNTIKNIKYINDKTNSYVPKLYKFDNLEEEVTFVANTISKLINEGININNIKIANLSDEYKNPIKRIFNLFNINIELDKKSLYSLDITQKFIKEYNKNIEITLEKIKENSDNYNLLTDVINKYRWCNNYEEIKEIIIEKIKKTNIKEKELLNKVQVIDYINDYISDDDYVFILNFNQGSIPKIIKDEEYLTDNLKEQLNLDTSIELNKKEKEITIESIKNIKNLTITYKDKSLTKTYYPSSLIKEMNLNAEIPTQNYNISYSKLNDCIMLTKNLDKLIKYGEKSEDLNVLYSNYPNIKYLDYDNSYQKIDKFMLNEYLDNKLNLSYTSLDNYNKCSFKYYISNILRLNKFESNFNTILGNVYHYILEKGLKEEIAVEEEINKYIKENNINFTNKEQFFFDKLIKNLNEVLGVIKKQNTFINLDKALYEEKIIIKDNNKIDLTFTGIIDKILYKEEGNKIYVALVDYKTGNIDLDLKYIEYGIGLQLPIYLYLLKEKNKDKEVIFTGFYLQKILKNCKEEDMYKELKLQGYSNFDGNILEKFDVSYKDSEIIAGLKIKNDGTFYASSKVLNNGEISKIIDITKNNISKSIDNIVDAKFDINSKKIDNFTNIGCQYCEFKDICYKKEKNNQIIPYQKDLSFLGGEIDAKLD